MNKIFCPEKFRVPPASNGIQVNFCKNPKCKNFGIPAKVKYIKRGRIKGGKRDTYERNSKHKKRPHLKCLLCKEQFPIKSNQAISEDLDRISKFLNSKAQHTCPIDSCPNHSKDISLGRKFYHSIGKTPAGSKRYKCKECGKTFSVKSSPTTGHKKPHKNREILLSLVNKVHLNAICKILDITMATLYGKIDWLYRQCCEFAKSRESLLLKGLLLPKLYIGVDRQFYAVNWTNRWDKRNVVLQAVGSADNGTGYVFGMHLNFDPELNIAQIDKDAKKCGDYERNFPFRKHARIWLPADFEKAREKNNDAPIQSGLLDQKIVAKYDEVIHREDVEVPDEPLNTTQLPQNGVQVHAEYTLYAHFHYLQKLLSGAEKIRFFLDQESGIRGACLSAFHKRIKARICDAYYVQVNKTLSNDEREKAAKNSKKIVNDYIKANPGLTRKEAMLHLLIRNVETMAAHGKWNDKWFVHPFPSKKEPEKRVSRLTDLNDYDINHRAWLYNKASTHMIDNFFQQVRRSISMLERPFTTPSGLKRVWYGYAPYNPSIIIKLLEIFRVYYNFARKKRQKETPAMKIGLAQGPVDINDILYGRLISLNHKGLKSAGKGGKKEKAKSDQNFTYEIPDTPAYRKTHVADKQNHRTQKEANATIFLDVETTGLSASDKIVEIAIIDDNGKKLFHSLINPERSIPAEAQRIHGITSKMVKNAPTMEMVEDELLQIVMSNNIVIYNADFDVRYLPISILKEIAKIYCCMKTYARYRGEWNAAHSGWKWVSLANASRQVGYESEGQFHRALADVQACRFVWKFMMGSQ